MKVLLVAGTPAEHAVDVPGREGFKDFADQSYNYAIGLLRACALESSGRNDLTIDLYDIPLHRAAEELTPEQLQTILDHKPDVIGFSCYAWDVHIFVKAAWQLKRSLKGMKVLLGGPSVSSQARRLLEAYPFLDIIVRGEGELPFTQMCSQGFEGLESVQGISYRAPDGAIVEVGEPSFVPDLTVLPSAYLSGHFRPDSPSLLIEPSRGCKFRCSFCSWSARGGGLRRAGRERLLGEVRWALENGYRFVNFCDTSINHDTELLEEFCQTLLQADPEHGLSYSVFIKQDLLDEEQFKILERMRFEEIILGLESIHPEPLKACGKRSLDIPLFEERLGRLGRAGQKVTLSFISGLPGDSVPKFAQTLDYLEDLQARMPDVVNILCCFWLSVLPGTRFEAKAKEYGFKILPRGTPYILSSSEHSTADLVEMSRMLVERCERNEHFRCEEIHRDAAEGRFPPRATTASTSPGGRGLGQATAQGGAPSAVGSGAGFATALEDFVKRVREHALAMGVSAVKWDGKGVGDRPGVLTLERPHGAVDVIVEQRNEQKACFVRAGLFNLYYHAKPGAELPGPEIERLMQLVASLAHGPHGRDK